MDGCPYFSKLLPLPKAEGEVARSVGGVHQLQNSSFPKDLVLPKKVLLICEPPLNPLLLARRGR